MAEDTQLGLQQDLAKLERAPRDLQRWQRAQQQLLAGRSPVTIPIYRELTARYPAIFNLWFEFATAAAADLDFALAMEAFGRAENLAANDSAKLIMLAQQFHRLRKTDRVRACYERAVEVDPGSTHVRLSLAAWLERERKLHGAQDQVDACLAKNTKDAPALYYHAFLLNRARQHAEAKKILSELVQSNSADPLTRISSFHLLAAVLDESGQYSEAMEWLLKAKALVRQHNNVAAMEQSYDKAVRARRGVLAKLTAPMIQRWKDEASAQPPRFQIAQLGGHPRSGTTLLEQILDAHPDVRAFDESEAFATEVGDKLAPPPPGAILTIDTLNGLPPKQRQEITRRYFNSLLRETDSEPTAKILLDKNPAITASLQLWLRIFPASKILIALRDPRDVIISCFFQNLALTPINANFLTLERAVKHYSDMMDTWLRLRELGGFDWLETRYENIVSDIGAEGKRVTEFLGLNWHEGQSATHESAQNKIVYSPTYSDVSKPVHSRAIGRWQNYAKFIEPILPRLEPYVKAFGYASV